MAKLYRFPEGGAFYDAFGGKLGEVEEIEFGGDSFDRDVAAYCANNVCAEPQSLSFTVKDCDFNPKALAALKGDVGVSQPGTVEFVCRSDTKELTEAIIKLQEQANELKAMPKAASGLRAALKTLNYKSELC